MARKNFGVTLIELVIVVATLAILITLSFFTFKTQLAKARDGRRKADLNKLQKALEDYMNDHGCYPNPEEIATDNIICGGSFSPYLNQLPCDPINNSYYNFFYSYDQREDCKTWYKIYAKLEYEKELIKEKIGCSSGCGPSKNYNYLVTSPNMIEINQIAEAEDWWPEVNTTISPSPTSYYCSEDKYYGCFNGICNFLGNFSPSCRPYYCDSNCRGECANPQNECRTN